MHPLSATTDVPFERAGNFERKSKVCFRTELNKIKRGKWIVVGSSLLWAPAEIFG